MTKNAANSPQEKFVLFQLSDVLSTKGNYIPAMLLDQFSIQLGLTNAQNILVAADPAAAVDNNQTTTMLVLEQVELFIYYYPCSQDDVRAIRLAAQTLERDGTSAYGMSFLTK